MSHRYPDARASVPSLLLFAIPCRSVRKTKLWARAVAASYAWLKATPGWPDDAALVQMKAGLRADLARAAQDAQAKLAAFDAKEGNLKANLGKVTAVLASPVKMEAAAPTENNPRPVAFPHVYGPLAPLSCVTKQMEVVRDPLDGTFLSIAGLCE